MSYTGELNWFQREYRTKDSLAMSALFPSDLGASVNLNEQL